MGFRLFDKIAIDSDNQISQTRSYAYALNTSGQTIAATGSLITLIYNDEYQDNLDEYNPTTGIFTSKNGGVYLVTWSALPDSHTWYSSDQFTTSLLVNDTDSLSTRYIGFRNEMFLTSHTGYAQSNFSVIVKIDSGDNLRIKIVNTGSSSVTMRSSGLSNCLTIVGIS